MRLRSVPAAMTVATALLLPALAGAQNRALGRPAFASDVYDGITGPANAVDGVTAGTYGLGQIYHSASQSNAWWYVQLDQSYDITQVDFWNRTDCCSHRIIGATIGLFNAVPYGPGGPAPLATATIPSSLTHQTFLFPAVSAQYVGILAPSNGDAWLQIAEVEVFGSPTASAIAPEPATVVLLGGGLLGIVGIARRRRA